MDLGGTNIYPQKWLRTVSYNFFNQREVTKTLKFQLSFTIKAFRLNFAITNIQKRTKLNIFHKEKINSGRSKSIKKGFGRI